MIPTKIDINSLFIFYLVASEGSITAAADKLFLTQPTVSYHIKSLENHIGMKLVELKRQKLTLTQAGAGLFQYAKEIYQQVTGAEEYIKDIMEVKPREGVFANFGPAVTLAGASFEELDSQVKQIVRSSSNGKVKNLSKTREEIIARAETLSAEYQSTYRGCGQCTFLAIIDSLRWGNFELISRDIEDRLFSGICVLTGGVGMTGDGTCGALASSVLIFGLALGLPREGQDDKGLRSACAYIRNTIVEKFYKKYGSIICKDVQRKSFGKAWDLTREDMSHEFLGITKGCAIMQAVKWSVEIMVDEFEKGIIKLP